MHSCPRAGMHACHPPPPQGDTYSVPAAVQAIGGQEGHSTEDQEMEGARLLLSLAI
jgi:hypothetical protein